MATTQKQVFTALGLMSGTSLDGVDIAWLETDGKNYVRTGPASTLPYPAKFVHQLRGMMGRSDVTSPDILNIERELTDFHIQAVQKFCTQHKMNEREIDVVGFHGQTLFHQPEKYITVQIGDGAHMAHVLGVPVVNQFRLADVQAGGHGAPLVPLFHAALSQKLPRPLAICNVGGVSNITWLPNKKDIAACDCGPGMALLNDWLQQHNAGDFDEDGKLSAQGSVDWAWVHNYLADPFFVMPAPKSLDRNHFRNYMPQHLNLADGAATLTMMTATGIVAALKILGPKPRQLLVCGGGRLNTTLMQWLHDLLNIKVFPVEQAGWNGDALEAQAFAYLAVRSVLGLPLSLPSTTGVSAPMCGGVLH